MNITAKFKFDADKLERMPVTIALTATLEDWRKIRKQLESVDDDPARPTAHCIKNIIDAIETATGHSYRTRGYSYEAELVDEAAE